MFGWFNKIRNKPNANEKEFSFIWYKELKTGNKTHYTHPFRTKVKAKNVEEAKEKVIEFALNKMKLVIVEEHEYQNTDLSKLDQKFDEISNEMSKMMQEFDHIKTTNKK